MKKPSPAPAPAPSGPEAAPVAEGVRHLDAVQLEELTRAFRQWRDSAGGPSTRRARGRVWLTFLVLRSAGSKLGETLALDDREDIDFRQSIVRFRNEDGAQREVQLPDDVLQEVGQFVEDPFNAGLRGSVFRMDQGHVRRKFQEVGQLCGLPRELSNPTALRRSRAVELLRGGMPVKVVQSILGLTTANLVANFLEFSSDEMKRIVERQIIKETARRTSARNTFFGKVTAVRRGDIQSEVELTTLGGFKVASVITNGSLKNMGLGVGSYAWAIVKAPWVLLAEGGGESATSARNTYAGTVCEVLRGRLATEVTVALADGSLMCSISTNGDATRRFEEGDSVNVMFTPASVILLLD